MSLFRNDAWDEILASRNQEMEKDEQDVLDEQSEIEELKKKKEKELLVIYYLNLIFIGKS